MGLRENTLCCMNVYFNVKTNKQQTMREKQANKRAFLFRFPPEKKRRHNLNYRLIVNNLHISFPRI